MNKFNFLFLGVKMLKSKKIFLLLLLVTGFLFFFGNIHNASAHKPIFISILSKIPGDRISKDYGFDIFYGHEGGFNPTGIKYQYDEIYKDVAIDKPAGANACIGLRLFKLKRNAYNLPALVFYCEYVRLVPKK